MSDAALRRITLCADDYGISPGVNRGIRELIARKRLNATSVMVVGPAIGRDDVSALQGAVAMNRDCAIGLHVTLTAPFHPLTMHYRPLLDGLFLPLGSMLRAGAFRRLDPEMIQGEVAAQIAKFTALSDNCRLMWTVISMCRRFRRSAIPSCARSRLARRTPGCASPAASIRYRSDWMRRRHCCSIR